MSSIGPDRVLHAEQRVTVGRLAAEVDALGALHDPAQAMAPADLQVGKLAQPLQEEVLDLALADVDEGREVVRATAGELEAEQLLLAEVRPRGAPLDAAGRDRL